MHLGCIFHLLLLLGVIFFAVWAIKNLSKDKFKKLWIWFLVIGLVGSIIFSGGARFKKGFHKGFSCDKADKTSIMQEVLLEQGFDVSDEQMKAMMESMKEKMGSMKGKAHGGWFKR